MAKFCAVLLVAGLVSAGCSLQETPSGDGNAATTSTAPSPTTSPEAPGNPPDVLEDIPFTSRLSLDVFGAGESGPRPVVVLFHGGGWVGGDLEDLTPLATAIAARGAVVFNAPYRLALRGGGYPMTFEDAACAVAFARATAEEYGGSPDSVTVVGYSAGAHIGAVTALAGDRFAGDCLMAGHGLPDSFVGVAGPYDSDLLDPLLAVFFGTDRAVDPGPWRDGNPYTHIGANSRLIVHLVHGDQDALAPLGFATAFEAALRDAGYEVGLTVVEGGDHRSVVDPTLDAQATIEAVFSVAR